MELSSAEGKPGKSRSRGSPCIRRRVKQAAPKYFPSALTVMLASGHCALANRMSLGKY